MLLQATSISSSVFKFGITQNPMCFPMNTHVEHNWHLPFLPSFSCLHGCSTSTETMEEKKKQPELLWSFPNWHQTTILDGMHWGNRLRSLQRCSYLWKVTSAGRGSWPLEWKLPLEQLGFGGLWATQTPAPANVRELIILELTPMSVKHRDVWEQPVWICQGKLLSLIHI